jgi:hypothetical protein
MTRYIQKIEENNTVKEILQVKVLYSKTYKTHSPSNLDRRIKIQENITNPH